MRTCFYLSGKSIAREDSRERGDVQQRNNEFRAEQASPEQHREARFRSQQQSHHQSESGEQ